MCPEAVRYTVPRVHLLDGAAAAVEASAVPHKVARHVEPPSTSCTGRWRQRRPQPCPLRRRGVQCRSISWTGTSSIATKEAATNGEFFCYYLILPFLLNLTHFFRGG